MDIKKIKDKLKKIFEGSNKEKKLLSKHKYEKFSSIMEILQQKQRKIKKELDKESKKNYQSDKYQQLNKEFHAIEKLIEKSKIKIQIHSDIINNEE